MEEKFKNKLSNYIKEKTGYLEELKVGNIFSEAGWDVRHSSYYLDRDEEKGREIDISARKYVVFKPSTGEKGYIELRLVCEVKKSANKHWVIFSAKKSHYEGWFGYSLYHEKGMKNILKQKIKAKVSRNSSINNFSRIGITYCEAFKDNTQKRGSDYSQIFRALTSSIKASEYFYSIRQDNDLVDYLPNTLYFKYIEFIEPVVSFNGLMYEAYLNKKNELELNEINHIPVFFNRVSPKYKRNNYIIDVVTIKELPNLLTSKEKWINTIKEKIQE
jgi:hypothetical protein